MAEVELIMPKMGESIMEATILKWLKSEGETFELDESVLEIATDKVDSDVPAPHAGTITKILFQEGDVVEVGKAIARYTTEAEVSSTVETPVKKLAKKEEPVEVAAISNGSTQIEAPVAVADAPVNVKVQSDRFYSPLVMNIARNEGIQMSELERIPGNGKNGRVTKKDILAYIKNRPDTNAAATNGTTTAPNIQVKTPEVATNGVKASVASPVFKEGQNVEIVEMDRMRKLIADHMVMSKSTSPHVTSFVEADVTNIVNWRNRVKADFQKKQGEKITFTPIFIEAVVKAIKDFPGVNVSVDGNNIIYKKDINVGMATALPSGNLIVPVIKNANHLNLLGITKKVNDLANRARANKLKPEEIQGGTFTMTNVGTFGNSMGTPIINQPQVAILATGSIKKKPAVLETKEGDVIAIRQMMFLSLSYDHRVVDGFLGGSFLRRVGDYLEQFDTNQMV